MSADSRHFGILDASEVREQARTYFNSALYDLASEVDRMMSRLLIVEWLAILLAALIVSARAADSTGHFPFPNVLVAVVRSAFILPALVLARRCPGYVFTRHTIAVAQILASALFINVTGGRLGVHFHVFGSLVLLAFYRDWRVLITAGIVTVTEYLTRGVWGPAAIYGAFTVNPWPVAEHAGWVAFENMFLIVVARRSLKEMCGFSVREAQLSWGAYHDVLTGLPNRRMLQQRFEASQISGDATGAVLFLDLDHFKQANDTLGHTPGDKLLKEVGQRLSGALRPGEVLARVGGDEFVIFIHRLTEPEEAMDTGRRLLASLTKPFTIDQKQVLLSASVGISLSPQHGTELATLQEHADRAMYLAKSTGRNQCVVFCSEVARRESVLKQIGQDLYLALPRGQIRLEFQPLVHRDGAITGLEALARWNHPQHGSIAPSEFIPLAERSGLIIPIGEWVLEEACRQCTSWQSNSGEALSVFVNISAMQFEQEGFPALVLRTLEDSGLSPSRLTLEITEGILIRDIAKTTAHLSVLRELGVRVAIDDFGTGYSSLSYLTTLPADMIKLDQSFVNREFPNGPDIIESIIDMAHRLGLRVVAEGIESRAQSDLISRMFCDEQQGFYFSPPLAADAVAGFLNAHCPAWSGALALGENRLTHEVTPFA